VIKTRRGEASTWRSSLVKMCLAKRRPCSIVMTEIIRGWCSRASLKSLKRALILGKEIQKEPMPPIRYKASQILTPKARTMWEMRVQVFWSPEEWLHFLAHSIRYRYEVLFKVIFEVPATSKTTHKANHWETEWTRGQTQERYLNNKTTCQQAWKEKANLGCLNL